jgi:hypothetical protein
MDTYSVETDPAGGYRVRITGPDGDNRRVMTGFSTRNEAQTWIDAQTQIVMRSDIASDGA